MECTRVREEILESFESPRPPSPAVVREAIDAHVAGCPDCARFLEVQHRLDRGLSRYLAAPELTAQFRTQLREQMQRAPRPIWSDWLPAAVHFASCGVATAACVALLPFSPITVVAAAAGVTLVSHFLLITAQAVFDAVGDSLS